MYSNRNQQSGELPDALVAVPYPGTHKNKKSKKEEKLARAETAKGRHEENIDSTQFECKGSIDSKCYLAPHHRRRQHNKEVHTEASPEFVEEPDALETLGCQLGAVRSVFL